MLYLLRVTFAPGGGVTAHVHPGATIYHLAAGTLQFTLEEGEARVVRAVNGVPAAATPTVAEAIPVGEAITLTAGDTVYYDGAAVQTERNDGDEPAVVLVANLRGVDEPARHFVDGTPTGA
jgi:quercetin dioxygenase-like cupin family protein